MTKITIPDKRPKVETIMPRKAFENSRNGKALRFSEQHAGLDLEWIYVKYVM